MKKPRLLLVEDDPVSLLFVKEILADRGDFEIATAVDGKAALEAARSFHPDLIISDYMMPEMNGIELCRIVKSDETLGLPIFMMLSVLGETERKTEGLESGADEYLTKPVVPDELTAKVRAFLRIKSLQDQLREDKAQLAALNAGLKRSVLDLVKLLTRLIDQRIPGGLVKGERTAHAAIWIATRLGLPQDKVREIEIGALLQDIGRIALPESLTRRSSFDLSLEEWPVFARHTQLAEMAVSDIEALKGVASLLRSQLENMDGTGYPDHLAGEEIPIGSRILRCVSGYLEFRAGLDPKLSHPEAIERWRQKYPGLPDPTVLQLLAEFLAMTEDPGWYADRMTLTVPDLTDSMTLAADLVTGGGVKLLPAGTRLSRRMVEHIRNHHVNDPIVAGVVVWRPGHELS